MTSRTVLKSTTPGDIPGPVMLDNLADHVAVFWDISTIPLVSVAGTGDVVTAVVDPPMLAGLVDGMKFTITWGAANTGPVTLAIGAEAAVAVVDAGGAGLLAGALASGLRSILEYVGGSLRMLTGPSAAAQPSAYGITFTASGTWTVPTGYSDDALVIIKAWGGGGGGDGDTAGGGGGGGACVTRTMRYADITLSSYTVTIGAGGAVNGGGGNTSVGSLVTAYGGGRGNGTSTTGYGGGGGGTLGAGAGATTGAGGAGGRGGGGLGMNDTASGLTPHAVWPEGGGGGGGRAQNGGDSLHGGGGGGGASGGIGGLSVFGGAGGASGAAGTAPGGGGGRNAAGARGEVRIMIVG